MEEQRQRGTTEKGRRSVRDTGRYYRTLLNKPIRTKIRLYSNLLRQAGFWGEY